MKKSILIIVLSVGVIMWAWVYKNNSQTTEGEMIKIGAVLPITGIAAVVGENEKNGIQLAVDEINASGGISGRKIEIIFEDDRTEPNQTVGAIQKLISVDKVDALIGGAWDFLANAAIPVIDREKKIMITPSALPDTLEKTSEYLFVTHSPVSLNETAIVEYLEKAGGNKVAIFSVNNLWGQAHLAVFKKAISLSGKTLVNETIVPQFDNNDIQRELSLLKPLHPDIFIVALNFGDSANFLRKKEELGISGNVLADFHVEDGYRQGNIPEELLSNVSIFVFSDPGKEFDDKYFNVFGKQPGTYVDTSFDAVYAIKQAIENERGKTDSASIIRGMRKIIDYNGASGRIDFSKHNYPENKIPIIKIFDGKEFVNIAR